jgi:hypothetical protein
MSGEPPSWEIRSANRSALLLLRCVLGELVGDRVGAEARGREVVLLVPQDARDLGGEGPR